VEQLSQQLGAVLIEDGASSFGTRRAGSESLQTSLVEVVDGVAHRLLAASEVLGYWRGLISPGGGQKHLRRAQGESVFRAQPGFEPFALVV
jgi:hypothetical protein